MAKYLIIESRDPFESQDSRNLPELIEGLADRGNEITLFLIQNGVLPLRKNSKFSSIYPELRKKKVKIMADAFSLRERAIQNPLLEVDIAETSDLVKLILTPNTKVIWH